MNRFILVRIHEPSFQSCRDYEVTIDGHRQRNRTLGTSSDIATTLPRGNPQPSSSPLVIGPRLIFLGRGRERGNQKWQP